MIICLLFVASLLTGTVLGKDCSATFEKSGSISTTTPSSPDTPHGASLLYCEYLIKAPRNSYIELNFTRLFVQSGSQYASLSPPSQSESSSLSSPSSSSSSQASQTSRPFESDAAETRKSLLKSDCLPNIAVFEVTSDQHEHSLGTVCLRQNDLNTPKVFRSETSFIKLNYSWESGQKVSFELTFMFHKWPSSCKFRCSDGSCLEDSSQRCNSVANCPDQSDEDGCSTHTKKGETHFIEVVVIVVVVVFTLGVVICVFFHYRLTSRLWRDHRHRDSSSAEHHHLTPHTGQSTEVVYVPGLPMDRIEREVAIQRERQIIIQGIQTDTELNLPPAISISEDGEEGYAHSQRLLQRSCDQRRNESIRPPPNKTIFQGDSPPPYRSNSVSQVDGHYYSKRGISGGGGGSSLHHSQVSSCLSSKHNCVVGNSPHIARCHSISSGDKRLHVNSSHPNQHSTAPSCGHLQVARPGGMCNDGVRGPGGHPGLHHPSHSSHMHSGSSHGVVSPYSGAGPGGLATSGLTSSQSQTSPASSATQSGASICSHSARPSRNEPTNKTPSSHRTVSPNCHSNTHEGPSVNSAYYDPPPQYSEVVQDSPIHRTGLEHCSNFQKTQSDTVV